jgi:hypothetical protein
VSVAVEPVVRGVEVNVVSGMSSFLQCKFKSDPASGAETAAQRGLM